MEKPWFKEYEICGIPRTLEPYPNWPTHFFLDRVAQKYPNLCCAQMGLEMTYSEIREHADRLAHALAGLGVEKGDRVATLLPTSLQFVIADAAISKAGAVHVPCSFLEAEETLAHKFQESSPKAMICLDQHLSLAENLAEHMAARNIIFTRVEDYSDSRPGRPSQAGALWMTDLIERSEPKPPAVRIDPTRDLETLLFTGGTTGIPKGCMLTHRNMVANALQNPTVFGPITKVFEGNAYVILGLPFFHSYGHSLMHTMIGQCMGMLLVVDPRDTKTMLKLIEEYHPVLQIGVPTQFMKMLQENGVKKARIIGISGSAALPPSVQEKFEEASGGLVTEGYGLSEMSPVTHFNVSSIIKVFGGRKMLRFLNTVVLSSPGIALLRSVARALGPKRFGAFFTSQVSLLNGIARRSPRLKKEEKRASIGIPLPDTEVKVVDVDTGAEIPYEELIREGRTGEMLLRGPQRMLGYWPHEGSGLDEEGWVHTGDVVRMDENGYFSIVDRTKDMVIVSGYKVYTREIDDLLYQHPATEVAATIGVPDPDRPGSERIKVYVQLKEEYKGKVTEEDYMNYLRDRVAKYAVPRAVVFIDQMPLTEVYKVNKRALREMEVKEMEEKGLLR